MNHKRIVAPAANPAKRGSLEVMLAGFADGHTSPRPYPATQRGQISVNSEAPLLLARAHEPGTDPLS